MSVESWTDTDSSITSTSSEWEDDGLTTPPEQTRPVWELGNVPVPPGFNTSAEDRVSSGALDVVDTNPTRNGPQPSKEIPPQQSPRSQLVTFRPAGIRRPHPHSKRPGVGQPKTKDDAATPDNTKKRRTITSASAIKQQIENTDEKNTRANEGTSADTSSGSVDKDMTQNPDCHAKSG
ncbi:uncharacterized protein N7479_008719 [Penicillium vulpinum]|uniref:Uncharacterized protein n=1 Tax=Penicillium vulpinum TaxID=29845 RepID=A0A1V6S1Q8_9EURO|nr:uncharacterized protein N7479_008719 [Penicillium vulpinum]KAJ5950306.1 hypothetical protein N7479_008719 [Penicillium vulpinum]OQE07684.1 hypothetical protein PENVUL_c012G10238 [Penicillium vulpinum]